jgi:hypothetical protein
MGMGLSIAWSTWEEVWGRLTLLQRLDFRKMLYSNDSIFWAGMAWSGLDALDVLMVLGVF